MSSGEEHHRIRLTIHYDGSGFHGWQVQAVERTVQGELEAAVERLTGRRRALVGSGRTDRGVHAVGQVASVDVPTRWTPGELRKAMNAVLPRDVWVADAAPAEAGFNPRFDAVARTYVYRIGLAEEAWSPFCRPWCWALRDELDRDVLDRTASVLVGSHSFQAFAKAGQPERGDRCTVHAAGWSPWDGLGLAFTVTADRYLHHMVRYLVGTMVDAARGRRPEDDVAALLHRRDPGLSTSPPAPPGGLHLVRVAYGGEARDLRPLRPGDARLPPVPPAPPGVRSS